MLIDDFIHLVTVQLGHVPTPSQQRALSVLGRFLGCRDEQVVMIMRGSAGTGKTSLAAAVVRTMLAIDQKVVLMAPTGRAAKVLALSCRMTPQPQTFTIHRRIYRQKSMEGGFSLNFNNARNALFIVDEASMVSNDSTSPLLDNLISFVYSGQNCRLLLVGDAAQLPPVGQSEAPALSRMMLEGYGLRVFEADVDQVLRQAESSGILWNANRIRLRQPLRLTGYPDIHLVSGAELIDQLASSYSKVGIDETMVVTRSNKRANIYNQGIRNQVLDREEELSSGDLLMVVKNKYLSAKDSPMDFIANGDRAVVRRLRHERELYGFRFVDAQLRFPDYDDAELTATLMLDTLHSEAPALTADQQQHLFEAVMDDYSDLPRKADRLQKLKTDTYYNALQVKFAYAVTCHKAQGGQWAHVYIDQGYMPAQAKDDAYYHWLYTAFTRATEHLFLVNWNTDD